MWPGRRRGQRGGDIELAVESLLVPPGHQQIRFRTSGSVGQKAEPGGVKDYVKTEGAPEDKLDQPPVSEDTVQSAFRAHFSIAKDFWNWTWPAHGDPPSIVNFDDRRVRVGAGGNVIDLIVVAHDDMFGDTNVFGFPGDASGYTHDYSMSRIGNGPIEHQRGALGNPFNSGRAYARARDRRLSRRPARRGRSRGASADHRLDPGSVTAIADLAGGAPGETPQWPPARARRPNPAFRVQMNVIKNGLPFFVSRTSQTNLILEEVTAAAGQSEPEKRGEPGRDGSREQWSEPWATPEAIDAVLAFARDAYRAGHRDLAQNALEPYSATLLQHRAHRTYRRGSSHRGDAQQPAQQPRLLRDPRLGPPARLSTNLEYFQAARQMSYPLLYYAATAEQKFDALTAKSELGREMGEVLGEEMDVRVASMAGSWRSWPRPAMRSSRSNRAVEAKQAALDVLTNLAEKRRSAIERHASSGGSARPSPAWRDRPAGQPYLGGVGDVISGVGDVDFTRPNQVGKQISEVAAKIGTTADTFIQKNNKVLIDDRTRAGREWLAADKAQGQTLADRLRKNKNANEDLARAVEEDTSPGFEVGQRARRRAQAAEVATLRPEPRSPTTPAPLSQEEAAEKAAQEGVRPPQGQAGRARGQQPAVLSTGLGRSIAELEEKIEEAKAAANTTLRTQCGAGQAAGRGKGGPGAGEAPGSRSTGSRRTWPRTPLGTPMSWPSRRKNSTAR